MSGPKPGPSAPDALRIGDWLLVRSTHTLQREGQVQRLPRRLVDLLALLASRPGETWTREDLLGSAWSRRMVNDEVLSRAVAELRGHLGDDAREPRYIETLPKTGYRLIAEVASADGHAARTEAAPTTPLPADPGGDAAARNERRLHRHGLWLLPAVLLLLVATLMPWSRTPQPERPAPIDKSEAGAGWTATRMLAERPFRSGPDWAHQPRFSRDGRWLVFVVVDLATGGSALWWGGADGSAAVRLDAGGGRLSSPVFSPQADRVAYLAWEGASCRLMLLELPSGVPRELAECAGSRSFTLEWVDGDRLLYSAPALAGRGIGLWSIDPQSGERAALTDPPAEAVADSHPRQAPDGRIAFLRGPDGQRELWVWKDGRIRRLIEGAHRVPDLAWTPEGDGLVVASDRDGFPALQWVDARSGATRSLGARGAATLDVAPDGRLLYEQRRYDANLWLYAEGAEPRRLTDSTRYEGFAALDPRGERLLYVSNRDGNGSIWLQTLADAREQRLDLPAAEAWVRPQWLDERLVVVTRYAAGGATSIEVFDLAAQRLLPEHPLAGPGFAALLLEGPRLLLGADHGEGGGMQLRLRGAGGEQPIAAARGVAEFRSDGQRVAWTRRGSDALEWVTLHHGDSAGEVASLPLGAVSAWSLHGGELFTAMRDAEGWAVWRRQLPDAQPVRWMAVRAAPADGQLVVSADGRNVVLSHIDGFAADLLWVPPPQSIEREASSRE